MAQLSEQVRMFYLTARQDFLNEHSGQTTNYQAAIHKHYPAWDGGYDQRGVKHRPIWAKIAQVIVTNNLDSRKFIQGGFRVFPDKPPWPSYFLSALALRNYHKQLEQEGHLLKSEVVSQLRYAYRCLALDGTTNKEVSYRKIIQTDYPLASLVRYYLAIYFKQGDLAKDYREAAQQQYRQAPDIYQELLGKLFV